MPTAKPNIFHFLFLCEGNPNYKPRGFGGATRGQFQAKFQTYFFPFKRATQGSFPNFSLGQHPKQGSKFWGFPKFLISLGFLNLSLSYGALVWGAVRFPIGAALSLWANPFWFPFSLGASILEPKNSIPGVAEAV